MHRRFAVITSGGARQILLGFCRQAHHIIFYSGEV
ncbi:hypothetical protein LTSERUB_1874, partial [Salmonella enterica subsp. enterica serovar Rubislaw str. A4-653]